MRAFIVACVVAIIIAIAAGLALDRLVQEPSSKSFSHVCRATLEGNSWTIALTGRRAC